MNKPDPDAYWLAGPLFMVLAPQLLFLPVWVSAAALVGLAWRISPFWRKDSGIQKRLRWLLVAIAMAGIFIEYHTLFGPRGGVGLLVLMTVLKLLESSGRRDRIVMTLAGYFLLVTVLIHDQRLPTALWLMLAALVLTASLVAGQYSGRVSTARALRHGALMFMQGLPLALLLFVLFPRLQAPIGLIHTEQARTGLSDSMSPGSIGQLVQSNAVAFRADFAPARVDGHRLYWRGPVLWDYDGRSWRRPAASTSTPTQADNLGQPLDYTVTLEASGAPWLPTTGLATRISLPDAKNSPDMTWAASRPVEQRLRYTVRAWQSYQLEDDLAPSRKAEALVLPAGANPETLALGQRWRQEHDAPQAVVDAALAYFHDQPFYYTLTPPVLGRNAVDDFLFGTRRGFCEHYAGAFAVLMRAAGIPTRVVTGYLGGEYNPLGDYWIVRQRDAHAWAEVWLSGRGWVRVDPTAAIAPSRIELNVNTALADEQPVALGLPSSWLKPFGQGWDYLDNGWNQWVIGYDFERQKQALSRISPSLSDLRGMLWGLVTGATFLTTALALYLLRPALRRKIDAASRQYDRFLRKLKRAGLTRDPAEGPESFAQRASRLYPDLKPHINRITSLYTGLRYGKTPADQLDELRQAITNLKIGSPYRRSDRERK